MMARLLRMPASSSTTSTFASDEVVTASRHQRAHAVQQVRAVQRLREEVGRAEGRRFRPRLRGAVGGHDDHRTRRVEAVDQRQEVEAVERLHHEVGDDEVVVLVLEAADRVGDRSRLRHLVLFPAQHHRETLAHSGLVVDDEDLALHAVAWGNDSTKHVPSPSWTLTVMVPPWSSMMRRTIARPSPVPPAFEVTNGSKTRGRIAAGIPPPVSRTSTSTKRSTRRVSTERVPPWRITCTALRSRFQKTCRSWSRSADTGVSVASNRRSKTIVRGHRSSRWSNAHVASISSCRSTAANWGGRGRPKARKSEMMSLSRLDSVCMIVRSSAS